MSGGIESARLKVARAMKIRGAAAEAIESYMASQPYEVVTDANGGETVRITKAPPPEIAVIAGEVLYQVRSALDHAFFDLVERNHAGATLPRDWERRSQFPLLIKIPEKFKGDPPVPRQYFDKTLDALTDRAFDYIESVQPYRLRDDNVSQWLRLLAKLSNIDKHRRLSTTVTRINRKEELVTAEGYTITSLSLPLADGAELRPAWHPPGVVTADAKRTRYLTPTIVFDEPDVGPPLTAPIENILYKLPTMMFGWMLPNLHNLLERP